MPRISVTLTEDIDVPEGTEIVLAPTRAISGLRLPDGTFLKPWTTFELYAPGNENGDPEGDASHDELMELGVNVGLVYERNIEVTEGEVETVASAIEVS